jgi:hypothetical protein
MSNPAICIVGFNRPDSLSRLLSSISNAKYYSKDIELVISIDCKANDEKNRQTVEIARNFDWKYGKKEVIHRENNYGLKAHILACGDMLLDKYDSMIMLEDDLFVSPYFYDYSLQLLKYYQGGNLHKIAGFSLYNHRFNETVGLPFEAIDDGYDNYFLQMPSSWGQMWTREQWKSFKMWYKDEKLIDGSENLPSNILYGSKKSWKWIFTKYIVEKDFYFVYPSISLTTNFGDAGTHHNNTNSFQVPLLVSNKQFHFSSIDNSLSMYDSFCELLPKCIKDKDATLFSNLTIDLYGTKNISKIETKYLLSSKKCHKPILSFGMELKPMDLNVLFGVKGDMFNLGVKDDFENEVCKTRKYDMEYYNISLKHTKRLLSLAYKMVLSKIKGKIFG